MNALIGIQQALIQRANTRRGSGVLVSLFDSAAELMAVPHLQARYGDAAPQRVGLRHPSIAPYGAFTCSDGKEFVLSIQNEREWVNFCNSVLRDSRVAADPRFSNNTLRTANRDDLERLIQSVMDTLTYPQAVDRFTEAQTAFGAINSVHDLIEHPQFRTRPTRVGERTVMLPASPYIAEWDAPGFAPIPQLDQHRDLIRAELARGASRSDAAGALTSNGSST